MQNSGHKIAALTQELVLKILKEFTHADCNIYPPLWVALRGLAEKKATKRGTAINFH